MARNIAVSDDVYELWKTVKLPGESFSDVIRRGIKRGTRLSDIRSSGTFSKEDWLKVRRTIRESEAITQRKLEKIFHY